MTGTLWRRAVRGPNATRAAQLSRDHPLGIEVLVPLGPGVCRPVEFVHRRRAVGRPDRDPRPAARPDGSDAERARRGGAEVGRVLEAALRRGPERAPSRGRAGDDAPAPAGPAPDVGGHRDRGCRARSSRRRRPRASARARRARRPREHASDRRHDVRRRGVRVLVALLVPRRVERGPRPAQLAEPEPRERDLVVEDARGPRRVGRPRKPSPCIEVREPELPRSRRRPWRARPAREARPVAGPSPPRTESDTLPRASPIPTRRAPPSLPVSTAISGPAGSPSARGRPPPGDVPEAPSHAKGPRVTELLDPSRSSSARSNVPFWTLFRGMPSYSTATCSAGKPADRRERARAVVAGRSVRRERERTARPAGRPPTTAGGANASNRSGRSATTRTSLAR